MNRKDTGALTDSIRQQIVNAVATGMWQRGDRLPSSREMATQLGVDARLITRAYQQLEVEGLVDLRSRSGAYIAQVGPQRPFGAPPALTESWIVSLLEQGVWREIAAPDVAEWLRRATMTTRLHFFVIAPTTDQVVGIRREIERFYGVECAGMTMSALAVIPMPDELRRADMIVTVDTCLLFAKTFAAKLGIPCLPITTRPDIVGPAWERLMQSPTFVVVSDERFGSAVAQYISAAPASKGGAPVRTLVAGRDDLTVIPADAVVYVTQGAREQLRETPINGSVLPVVRALSRESSSALLEFIVAANLGALRARQDIAARADEADGPSVRRLR